MTEANPALLRSRWLHAGLAAAGLAIAALAGGCATTGSTKVDQSRLAGLPPSSMTLVTDQQQALDAAIAQEDAAKQDKIKAENRVMQAKADRGVSNAELAQAKTRYKQEEKQFHMVATSESTDASTYTEHQERARQADQQLRAAQARADADNARVSYLESLATLADGKVNLAKQQVNLDKAELERARLITLQKTNPAEVQAMKVHPADFDAAVARREADVANANANVARDRADASAKYRTFMVRRESVHGEPRPHREWVPPPPQA